MVNYAACYPGQGAQKQKMALDLHARSAQVRDLFALASDVTGVDVYRLLDEADEQTLQQTEFAQLAITLANRSAALVLREAGIQMACHAGFSLGELSAYAGAGVLSDADLFRIVRQRGLLMAKASEHSVKANGELGMAAVVGIGFDQVSDVLKASGAEGLFCANDNGPTQVVVSGTAAEIAKHTELLKAAGARRVIALRVSGPFHTPFMASVEQEFAEFLDGFEFSDPVAPLYVNLTGYRVETGAQVKKSCIGQLSSPVRWTQIMRSIVEEQQVSQALEIGPGTVLSGLWRSSGFAVGCSPAGTYEDISSLTEGQA